MSQCCKLSAQKLQKWHLYSPVDGRAGFTRQCSTCTTPVSNWCSIGVALAQYWCRTGTALGQHWCHLYWWCTGIMYTQVSRWASIAQMFFPSWISISPIGAPDVCWSCLLLRRLHLWSNPSVLLLVLILVLLLAYHIRIDFTCWGILGLLSVKT